MTSIGVILLGAAGFCFWKNAYNQDWKRPDKEVDPTVCHFQYDDVDYRDRDFLNPIVPTHYQKQSPADVRAKEQRLFG